MGSAFFGIGYWAHFRHFRFLTTPWSNLTAPWSNLTTPWSKFDHVVVPSQKKPFAVPKSHKDTIYFLRGARGPVSCGLYGFETCLDSAMAQNCKCFTQFSCMTDFKRVTNSYKPHETEPWAPHRTYIVPLWLLGTAKGFFCDGTTTWSNLTAPWSNLTTPWSKNLKRRNMVPAPMLTHKTTSDPLYSLV